MSSSSKPGRKSPPSTEYQTISAQYQAAKRLKEAQDAELAEKQNKESLVERQRDALEASRKAKFEARWWWTVAFWFWMLCIHGVGIGYFTSGFLLTRLVLDEKSSCESWPLDNTAVDILPNWPGKGSIDGGCWHPKTFDKAVIILIDALRYDFTVPVDDDAPFHNAFPFLYDTAVNQPHNAFLRPFIADPPTATLQRLKGLTTGTLPTFIDLGSNFAGTAIEEDNLLIQLRNVGKRIVHLGDDTWHSLFPGYFEANLSRPYDSFNVWDLHSVDNGVTEHIFPLMGKPDSWDLLIGHFLGVDHAGHRYGPDHVEMTKKLRQMDDFVRKLVEKMDDKTLLIVMGDHGMDGKGDHGGESDDEVEAALWMYSTKPVFGRTKPDFVTPPPTAKIRPVNQIDLVPTLALLLGLPIPYNNLGKPIEEAFAGRKGNSWDNLAAVARVSAAGIKRYQASYFAARGIEQALTPGSPAYFWAEAEKTLTPHKHEAWASVYSAFSAYQEETLAVCKSLWARFDVPSMIVGIIIMAIGVLVLLVYVSRDEDDDVAILDDVELDMAEKKLELQGIEADQGGASFRGLNKSLVLAAAVGALPGFGLGALLATVTGAEHWLRGGAAVSALVSLVAVTVALFGAGKSLIGLLPTDLWGWLTVFFTVGQSVGFASNSYTIWEDSILLFFTSTFGIVSGFAALRLPSVADRYLAIYNSVLFVVLGRVASYSKLCREEQMPYCTSTYYSSSTSSTSAPWQLAIPFVVFAVLPSVIKAYLVPTRSYEGLAPNWIGYVFRTGLFMSAAYWVLDAADNGDWISGLPEKTLKTASVYVAQTILGLALVAGTTAFIWAPPCISILTAAASKTGRTQVAILGYANAHGARYLLLPVNILAACFLLSKPMGGGALALMMWQVLSLVEIMDLNGLAGETIGPVMLGVLGNYHFFKTGHQTTLSSIQWDAAFIPLFTIRYPWTPLVVVFNSFAGQIIAATSIPLVVLWKVGPRKKGTLESVTRALAAFVAYFAVESLATMAWAGWLRRHLMLYRVFNPRYMAAAIVLLVVDVAAILISLTGYRVNTLAVNEVFGWSE
jgi:phosphatidylinositol glycan class O